MAANHILHLAYPLFIFLIVLEVHFYKRRGLKFPARESTISLLIALAYQLVNYLFVATIVPLNRWFHEHSLFDLRDDQVSSWLLGFFALEFAYYWQHRCGHRIRWLWASHCVHHSPPQITFSGAYRLGVTGIFSGLFVFFLPLMWIGFSPKMVSVLFAVNLIYQFWLHTELIPKLGPLEHIFNTPSHHRVHHAINDGYLDKNFGGVLIIFDRLFGTYAIENDEIKSNYGLVGKKPSHRISDILFHEWRSIARDVAQAPKPSAAFMYMFGPPGWKPEGPAASAGSPLPDSLESSPKHIAS